MSEQLAQRVEAQASLTQPALAEPPARSNGTSKAVSRHRRWERRSEAARQCAFERRVISVGMLLHCATQVMSLHSWSTLPQAEVAQRLGSIAFSASLWLLPTLAPAFYVRWRHAILLAFRIGFFSFPLLRQARGGCCPTPAATACNHAVHHCQPAQRLDVRLQQRRLEHAPLPASLPARLPACLPAGIQQVLDAPPTPNRHGILLDLCKIAFGELVWG